MLLELCDVLTRVSSLLNDPALPLALFTGVFFGAITNKNRYQRQFNLKKHEKLTFLRIITCQMWI